MAEKGVQEAAGPGVCVCVCVSTMAVPASAPQESVGRGPARVKQGRDLNAGSRAKLSVEGRGTKAEGTRAREGEREGVPQVN